MALSSTGLSIRRASEWVEYLRGKYTQNLPFQPTWGESDPLTQEVNIQATLCAILSEDLLAVYQSMDLDQAEGVSLDREARRMGVTRNKASYTSGFVRFYGNNNTTIPAETLLQNPFTEQNFITTETRTLSQSDCDAIVFTPTAVTNGKVYSVDIQGITYSYTASTGDTLTVVVTQLAAAISNANITGVTASYDGAEDTLRVYATTEDVNVLSGNNTELNITTVELETPVRASETGPVDGQQYSVNTLVTPLGGVSQVQNLTSLGEGRDRETDAELRARVIETLAQAGGGTVPAIYAGVLDVAEVSSVEILENTTSTTDSNGLPPYSIKIVVVAPDTTDVDEKIAEAIHLNRPAGRKMVGDTSVDVEEGNQTYPILFSRPIEQPIAVRVTATRYTEEPFPVDGLDKIKAAVVSHGGSLGTGVDVITGRFYKGIYNAVDGLDMITVEVQTLTNSGDTPVPTNWSTSLIPINSATSSTFAAQDVYPTVT